MIKCTVTEIHATEIQLSPKSSRIAGAVSSPITTLPQSAIETARQYLGDYQTAMQGWRDADPPPGVTATELDGQRVWQMPDGSYREPERVNLAGVIPAGRNEQTGEISMETGRMLPLSETAMGAPADAVAAQPMRGMANSYRVGYNPPPKPQRPFSADYPAGAQTDDAGRLLHDIEGRTINPGAFIAGRRTAAGVDEALRPEELVEGATRLTGQVPEGVARSTLPRRGVGAYLREPGQDAPSLRILFDKSLSPDHANRVIAHETGHAIDDIAGTIQTDGLTTELRRVYSTLATGQERARNLTDGPGTIIDRPPDQQLNV